MDIKQISVFIENKPGRLAAITKFLAEHEVDIRAVSIADTRDFGILRLIVDDPDKTVKLLRDEGYTVSITSVIAVAMEDEPGSLAHILEILYHSGVTVEYMYAFITRKDHDAYVVLRVEDEKARVASNILEKNGVVLASPDEIYSL